MTAVDVGVRFAAESRPFAAGRRTIVGGILVGMIGAGLLVLGGVGDPFQALCSYLVAYAYLFAIVVGALAFVLSIHAAGSVWPTAVRRFAEAVMALTPLLALMLVPVLVGASVLYPWMHPERIASEEVRALVLHKRPYLNLPFVIGRAVGYFGFFLAVTVPMRRWSLRLDRPGLLEERLAIKRRMRVLSSLALPGLGIFGTMAGWDWLMSLSPTWYSTIFGLNYLSGGFVAALAVIAFLTALARRAGYLPRIGASHFYALGRMMFAFLVFWGYTAYFQYMLSWIANKPMEAEWFWRRTHGGYGAVALFVTFGSFGLPFVVLLSYWIKRRAWGISLSAVWIVVSQYFAVHWIVAAARDRVSPFSWMDGAAVLCVGGLALAFATWRQRGLPVAPVYDPAFARALEYTSR